MTAPERWAGTAAEYAATFAKLCAGALPSLVDAAQVVAGELALDVGCGTGATGLAMRGVGARVVATDPDPQMVAHTARLGLTVLRTGLPRLAVGDGSVDLAVASFVVNHLDDPRAGMHELARVARDHADPPAVPGGVVSSARNRFVGLVTDIKADAVMAQVELQCGPFRVVSLMSSEAVRDLGIELGSVAVAVIKSTNVIVETTKGEA